ncbi:BRCA1 C terminus domain-containing protein [Astrocystis sublimbata]|nr:BRCA1 C terminus domain-containing protein [Astrocystis sublimbata]
MAPSKPPVPPAAEPVFGQQFDPWNSSSSGHQRAENRIGASTGWRHSRNQKLMGQFTGGAGGGKRISDTVGEGSQHWDPQAKALITPEARARAQSSVLHLLAKPGTMTRPSKPDETTAEESLMARRGEEDAARERARQARKIFDGVVVYLNGSTHPLVSDHKLKHVLAENGGSLSSHLGRRKVTHVILGRSAAGGRGSGGGLAGGKLQKEIAKMGGPAVKYVTVQWVLESIKAGKRLPEARFAELKLASKGQQSVYGLYSKAKDQTPAVADEFQPPPSGQA